MSRQEQLNRYLWKEKEVEYKKPLVQCPHCKSKEAIKRGQRHTKNRGEIQRYSCKKCHKRFVINDGFFRMRNNPAKITASLDLYFKGLSLRKLKDFLGVHFPHNASHMTILRWVRKYSEQIGNFTDKLPVNNSNCITFDEIEYKTKGIRSFFVGVMDLDSRYILSSNYTMDRELGTFITILSNAKRKSINSTFNFYTDGLAIYRKALKKVYKYKKHAKKFNHRIIRSQDKKFNWKIERFNNTVRERTKVMRHFGSLDSAKKIMKGFEIYYNFCRNHTGIGCFPYEKVTGLKLGKNKWLDLIRLSNQGKF